jgi:adenylate kinase
MIVNEKRMKNKIQQIIEKNNKKDIIIDGHYAASVVPSKHATHVFVLRRNPVELRKFMEKAGFSGGKLWENLASEILDVCLVDALNVHGEKKVCELDVTGKGTAEIVEEILSILSGRKQCRVGIVDWIGKLESEGILDDYLRI